MARALAFVLLLVVTNASLVLLVPLTPARVVAFVIIYGCGTSVTLALLLVPSLGWLAAARTSLSSERGRCVALTFDDGPTPDVTPKVLDVLRAKGVMATFFFVGSQVEANPELATLVSNEGHAIGNHTYSHPVLFCFLTPSKLRDELARGQDAIRRATGVTPKHFRSPVGLRHPLLTPTLERFGMEFVLWSIRSYDTWPQTAGSLRQRILAQVQPGAIILLHDRPGQGSSAMLEVLPDIIDHLLQQDYRLVTI